MCLSTLRNQPKNWSLEDATALAADVAAGRTTAVMCMQTAIDRAESLADYGAIVRMEAEMALENARVADAMPRDQRGPFHGVPFLPKDLGGHARGLAPCAGNAVLRAQSVDPLEDDALFSRFRAMGLLPFGLTTSPEFGLALTSEPSGYPPARNPFDRSLSSGGSSGGAATAVAFGIVPIAHATDAAGSIRVPAACCGLVGLKASRGRVPGAPHFKNHLMGIASELVLSRSVRDTLTVFDGVKTPAGWSAGPIGSIGVFVPDAVSNSTAAKLDEVAESCAQLGLAVKPVTMPDQLGTEAFAILGTIFAASLASWVNAVGLKEGDMSPLSLAVVEQGRSMPASELFDQYADLVRFSYEIQGFFNDIDALLMPVLSDGPPSIGCFDPQATDPRARYAQMEELAPNIGVANVAGTPSLAMPFGMMLGEKKNLPFGFQIMGPIGSDERLLQLAASLEALAPTVKIPHAVAGTP